MAGVPKHPPFCPTRPNLSAKEPSNMFLWSAVASGSLLLTSITAFVPKTTLARRNHHVSSCWAVKQASFGMGCFWKPSEELLKVDGVLDTVVGYTGHPDPSVSAPSYESVCYSREWVEGVRVEYDDQVITYEHLLEQFFNTQEPKAGSRQYASIIFAHDEGQRKAAEEWYESNQNRIRPDGVPASFTRIEPLSAFYKAEDYHQNYWQKTRPRFGGMLVLTALGSGLIDRWMPVEFISPLHTTTNGLVLLGLLYVLIERKIQTKTVQI